MNDIRSKFEEIWPVPEGIYWDGEEYMPIELSAADDEYFEIAAGFDIRLDTFTRCQETTVYVLGLVEELVKDLEECYEEYTDVHGDMAITKAKDWIAKQIMERSK